jgi:hypothetical protein
MKVRRFLAFVLCFAAFAPSLAAEDAFESAFLLWAKKHGFERVALVVKDPSGASIAQAGLSDPFPIASISKTIAGQCVMHLSREGVLPLDSTTGEVLGWSGPQGAVTVAQLLTHTSGFGPDTTQRDILGRNLTNQSRVARTVTKIATRALRSPDYFYNNENYLVLEAVVTAVLQEDAVDWCLRSVPALAALKSLAPAKVAHALGFAGGLAVSAEDLAMLFHGLAVAEDWPSVFLQGHNTYGPGVIIQTIGDGQNLFHVGGLCLLVGPDFGAFAARLVNGNSVAVMYSGCADDAALGELNAFVLAHFGPSAR